MTDDEQRSHAREPDPDDHAPAWREQRAGREQQDDEEEQEHQRHEAALQGDRHGQPAGPLVTTEQRGRCVLGRDGGERGDEREEHEQPTDRILRPPRRDQQACSHEHEPPDPVQRDVDHPEFVFMEPARAR